MQKAIFLDRDGTIIENGKGYLYKQEDLFFLPGVIEALRRLQECFQLFIVTNQSGIGRGYFSEADYIQFNNKILSTLEDGGVFITKVYYCPHHPDENCICRKPSPHFLLEAQQDYDLDLGHSWMIGDSEVDIEVAQNANIKSIQITEKETSKADFHTTDLLAASKIILSYEKH